MGKNGWGNNKKKPTKDGKKQHQAASKKNLLAKGRERTGTPE